MRKKLNLHGKWMFQLDAKKEGLNQCYYLKEFTDEIILPTTTSEALKGDYHVSEEAYYLTDPYHYEGYSWYSKTIEFTQEEDDMVVLVLERTRISHVWVDDHYIGMYDSLCTSHHYDLSKFARPGVHKLTIMIDNTSYATKGGHMTSCDTQTNWNGITGEISLQFYKAGYLSDVKITSNVDQKTIHVTARVQGLLQGNIQAIVFDETTQFHAQTIELKTAKEIEFTYQMPEEAILWSEFEPKLYTLVLNANYKSETLDIGAYTFGLREFKACGDHFEINHQKTFLRGKHDGMIFPLTGYAPTEVEAWEKVMQTAKHYGINHYRFHTCCPPEAAFVAADELGIYMEPELPFWGTVKGPFDEGYDEKEQKYLIEEGYRILKEFGNHPSFVMMSLGNELWGSQEILSSILRGYKQFDNRHLYVQGSNNFQFSPCILEEDDFFSGVRFSKNRLIRGSYAMCDAPQGHIQTKKPTTSYNYDELIEPRALQVGDSKNGTIQIQYGTGVKEVEVSATKEMIPQVPVVSHEIGQYGMYPNYNEIAKYKGVLRPENLKVFQRRLAQTGFLHKSNDYFMASGKFAVQCYKEEIETAIKSKKLAGFQLLDLQDFTGQGTALVGVLDAFMESKGLITEKEFRRFCSDAVLLAEFKDYVLKAKEVFEVTIEFAGYQKYLMKDKIVHVWFGTEKKCFYQGDFICNQKEPGIVTIANLQIPIPEVGIPQKAFLKLYVKDTEIENSYTLWIYPKVMEEKNKLDLCITSSFKKAYEAIKRGEKILFFPTEEENTNSIEGTYCTDFWNYPMFRSISESCNKPIPIGTHGLLIRNDHSVFSKFPCESYSTPQWWEIVMNSRSVILDDTILDPIVQTIDNVGRNHRLGLLFEACVGKARLFVCTSNLKEHIKHPEVSWLYESIVHYMSSDLFHPSQTLELDEFRKLFILSR